MGLEKICSGVLIKNELEDIIMGILIIKGDFSVYKLQKTIDSITEKNGKLNDIQIIQELKKVYPDLEMEYIDRLYSLEI